MNLMCLLFPVVGFSSKLIVCLPSPGKGFLINVFHVYGHLTKSAFLILDYEVDLFLSLPQTYEVTGGLYH